MSGRKCSDYHLDAERERKSQQLSSISARERQVTAMRQQLAETLARLSPVARRRFATEVAGAEEWPRQIAIDATTPPRLSISSLEADLNSAADHLSGRVASGQTAQRSLEGSKNSIARGCRSIGR